jgi:hypothetical protein
MMAALGLALLLAACGGEAIFSSEFDTLQQDTTPEDDDLTTLSDLPDGLRGEGLNAQLTDQGWLDVSVDTPGRGQTGHLVIEATEGLSDYSVSMRVRLISGEAQLWARSTADVCAGYGLIVDPTNDNYRLSTIDETCDLQAIDSESRLDVPLQTWHDMQIDVQGDSIRGLVDGVVFFEETDTTYTDGLAAVQLWTDGAVPARLQIDRLSITPR